MFCMEQFAGAAEEVAHVQFAGELVGFRAQNAEHETDLDLAAFISQVCKSQAAVSA